MNNTSYHPIAKFCHWAIVAVVAGQFVTSWLMAEIRHGASPNVFNIIHASAWPLVIIPLGALLLFMRFYKPVAIPEDEQKGIASKLASAMQYALYILLFVVPLSGWVMMSFRHIPINFLGLFNLPILSISNPSFLFTLGRMHEDVANILGILALAHASAALYHHFILKDSVLTRMWLKHSA